MITVVTLASVAGAAVSQLNFVLPVVVFAAMAENEEAAFAGAFFAGVIVDIVSPTNLGLSSLFFLLCTLAILLYKRRFHPGLLPGLIFLIIFEVAYGPFTRGLR